MHVRRQPRSVSIEDIVVDAREKNPLWDVADDRIIALPTGDYSLVGYERIIAVERKSIDDLYNSLGANRARFLRCIRRLSMMDSCMVIEGNVKDVLMHMGYGKLTPQQVMATVVSWAAAYRIPMWFASTRDEARSFTMTWMKFALAKYEDEAWRHRGPVCPCGGGPKVTHSSRCVTPQ